MRARLIFAGALVAGVAYLGFWPVSIDPVAWQPGDMPAAEGSLAPNARLQALERIALQIGRGPEAVNIDASGRIVTGFIDGRVMRFDRDGGTAELIADTQGRPLGIAFAANGDLIVADAVKGLLRMAPEAGAAMRVVANVVDGIPVGFADDVDVSADDVAYWSDASVKFGVHEVMEDVFESRPNGRLIATDLKTGVSRVLLPAVHFANGVALGPDDAFVVLTETTRYRVLRYWLKGPKAGQSEVLIENLPGFPDNITYNGRDRFWLAIYAPRTAQLDGLLPHPWLRRLIWRLPKALQPGPKQHGYVLGLDHDGAIIANLQDAGPNAFAPITSVREGQDYLYMGSLSQPSLARLRTSELP